MQVNYLTLILIHVCVHFRDIGKNFTYQLVNCNLFKYFQISGLSSVFFIWSNFCENVLEKRKCVTHGID